jgi:glycosyltransferase involved in cell wall biosynthesis
MDIGSDAEILAATSAFVAGRTAGEVLHALYHPATSDTDEALDALTALLPIEQIAVVRLLDRLNLSALPAVVILLATLRRIRTDEAWIHYNLSKHLSALIGVGVQEAKLPAIIHSLLALEGLKDTPGAHPLPVGVLARELASFAPREAIRRSMLAARNGDEIRAAPLVALGLEAITGRPAIAQLLQLATELHLSADNIPNIPHATSLGSASGLRTTMIEPPRRVIFPAVHGDASHYIFSSAGREVALPGISVHTLEGGTFSIDASMRGLERHYGFDRNGDCVLDFANGADPFVAETVLECDEPVAVLDDRFSGVMNICHFLLDRVTRIALYERAWSRPGKFFLVDDFPYHRDIFTRLGLADRVIIPSSKRVSIRAPELLLSSNIAADFRHPAHYCADWAIEFLRRALGIEERPARPGRKLLISRADTKGRRILNWDEVLPVFGRHGFEIVELAGLSTEAQMALFREASQVVGVHGAGLTNILFAPRDCAVLEILPPLVAVHDYWLLASALGQHYSALIAEDPELPRPDYATWQHNAVYNERDIVLPADRLEAALAALDDATNAGPAGPGTEIAAASARGGDDPAASDPTPNTEGVMEFGVCRFPEDETLVIEQIRLAIDQGNASEARQRLRNLEKVFPANQKNPHQRFALRGSVALTQADLAPGALDPDAWMAGIVISEDPVVILSASTSVEMVDLVAPYYQNRPVHFFIGMIWSVVYDRNLRQRYHDDFHRVSSTWPNARVTFLANDVAELTVLRDIGVPSVLVNHNAFVDESIYRVIEIEREFDAVYTARFSQHKRHDLATDIGKITLIVTLPTAEGVASLREMLPQCNIANEFDGKLEHLSPKEVTFHLNTAKCGLCLSPVEGAMFSSMEYLLCGLPVVTIDNIGGRNWFFSHDYTIFCDAHPAAVSDAVRRLISREIPREYIREAALQRVRRERQAFFSLVDAVFRENAQEARRFELEFERIFFDKMNYAGRRAIELLVP